jgi:SEC-C motif-containing protein
MRSRYTAYVTKNIDYVTATTDPQRALEIDVEAARAWAEESEFFKLEVLNSASEGNKGTVEFKAHFRDGAGVVHVHHELSKFRKQGGVWYFRDGKVFPPVNPS